MPTLPMLDVAIGMTFLFLLISLICTALNEILEALLKNRATDLEQGIREMLDVNTQKGTAPAGKDSYVRKLYEHPFIYSLFPGKYREKATLWRRSLPSYIPARTFALALMDIVLPANESSQSGTAYATNQLDQKIAAGDKGADAQVPGQGQPNAGQDGGQNAPANAPVAPVEAIVKLRAAVNDINDNEYLKKALLPLIDAAGNDITVARENIENWYNSTMDRVAGWYKRRSQVIILIIGFLVAVGLNADAVAVCKSLLNDPALRNSVVAAAANYKPDTPANAKAQLDSTLSQLEALKLPIGWDWADAKAFTGGSANNSLSNKELAYPTVNEYRWKTLSWWLKILGWFITGVAVSLGSPFWFDVLNKFMVVRSTVKPHEKSKEEASEDRQ